MEFKGTKGEWYRMNAKQMGVPFIVASGNETLFQVYGDDAENNAKLITAAPEMFEMLKQAKTTISRLGLSMSAHPDYEVDSEFYDYVDLADEKETEIEQLLTKITQ